MEATKVKRLTKEAIESIKTTYASNPGIRLDALAETYHTTKPAIKRVLGLIKHRTNATALPVSEYDGNGGVEAKAKTAYTETETSRLAKSLSVYIAVLEKKLEEADSIKSEWNSELKAAYEFQKTLGKS